MSEMTDAQKSSVQMYGYLILNGSSTPIPDDYVGAVSRVLDDGRVDHFTHFNPDVEPSRAQQEFAEECDVNHIMEKYQKTGQVSHFNTRTGVYGDFSEAGDFREAMEKVIHVENAFAELPAQVRARFENDPGKMVEFLNDDKNKDEAIKLGLVIPKPSPAPDPVLEEMKNMTSELKSMNAKNKNKNSDS